MIDNAMKCIVINYQIVKNKMDIRGGKRQFFCGNFCHYMLKNGYDCACSIILREELKNEKFKRKKKITGSL